MSNKILNKTLYNLTNQTCNNEHLDALFRIICNDLEDKNKEITDRQEIYMKILHQSFKEYSHSNDKVVKKLIKDLKSINVLMHLGKMIVMIVMVIVKKIICVLMIQLKYI